MEALYWIAGVCLAFWLGQFTGGKLRERQKSSLPEEEMRQRVTSFIEELEITAGSIIVELEEKQKKLDEALRIADRKIALLKLNKDSAADSSKSVFLANKQNSFSNNDEFPSEEPKYKQVHYLAQQGMGITEIAQQLKMGTGEVKLILGLSEKRQSN